MRKWLVLIAVVIATWLLSPVLYGLLMYPRIPDSNRYGYIDTAGNWVLKPQYDSARSFHGGVALVWRLAGFWHRTPFHGFINEDGKQVLDCDSAAGVVSDSSDSSAFSEGLIATHSYTLVDHKMGFVDKSGRFVIEPVFDQARNFSDHLAAVEVKGKWGFIDRTGKFVIEPRFKQVDDFHEGLAALVILEEKYKAVGNKYIPLCVGRAGYIDKTGKFVIPEQYIECGDFSEGLAPVLVAVTIGQKKTERWGYIDRAGKMVIQPRFGIANGFSESLAEVMTEGERWSYIDTSGRTSISLFPQFYAGGYFTEGRTWVVTRKTFPERTEVAPGKFTTRQAQRYGYIDKRGKLVIPCKFSNAQEFSEGRAAVQPLP